MQAKDTSQVKKPDKPTAIPPGLDISGEDMKECVVCSTYVGKKEAFFCPKCRRGPLCRQHRVSGEKWCTGCVAELKVRELQDAENQNKHLKSFMLFLQFIFMTAAILFAADRFGLADVLEQLYLSAVAGGSIYICVSAVFGYLICFVLIYNQRQNIQRIEAVLKRIKYE